MSNMEKEDFDVHDVGEVISSSGYEDVSTSVTLKEEMYSDELSDVKPDNSFETVLVNSNESVPCPKLEKAPESANDMGTPFLFVGVKMEMPDDYESEVSCANSETQYSSEEYSKNTERECKGVDECSEGSSAMIVNNTSYVQVKKEFKEDIEICEFDLQTNDDISMTTDTKCTFDSTSEEQDCDMGHSSEKFINGMEYLEYPILRVKEEGEHRDEQIADNRKNSDFGQSLGELNSEEVKKLNQTVGEAETLKPRECASERLLQDKKGLGKHPLTHTGEKLFPCDTCQKPFSQRNDLTRHMRTHTKEKPYLCDMCHKSYSLKQHLTKHYRTHTGERPYSCDVCSAAFSAKEYLRKHVRIHTSRMSFLCNICKKSYFHKHQLKMHMRIHTGEKPFTCHICSKSFSYGSNLKDHMSSHNREKPYVCDICQKSFSLRIRLQIHLQTHSGVKPFSCDTCQKSFSLKKYLISHLRSHTGEKR